ncbi:nitroreductase family protein [Flavobacterium gelatinilyticum]|uniref:nitroreductase family protein n=1 Tax=Flavobacterium gelatinilyticum TaxID=3003260 RepID=UPI00247FB772|nr:nitroreductase [Flavobacterium gelatinilyticum]
MKNLFVSAVAAILLYGCSEPKIERTVFEGSSREAIISNILKRRSIRKYTDQQVTQQQLDTIMKCAIYAPSALNKQTWEIRVVQNQKILEEMNKRFLAFAQGKELQGSASRYREEGFSIFHHAPTLIVMAGEKGSNYTKLDAGLALQNILLSANALDLGTCPIGSLVPVLNLPENEDILKLLNIPEGYEVTINVALGHPAENPEAPIRYSDKVKIIK